MARGKKSAKPKRGAEPPKKIEIDEPEYVDYKDVDMIKRFVNEQGKLLPRRVTGVSAKFQRQLTRATKRARHLSLIPFVADAVR
ncbi:MAG: small subunit ribosomal protein S18 [Rhodothermales bacterium]|jgi:small subunit ribosomal protein S18